MEVVRRGHLNLITINTGEPGCLTPRVVVPAAATSIWSDNLVIFPDVVRVTGQHAIHMQVVDSVHGGPCKTVGTMFSFINEMKNVQRKLSALLDVI